MLEPESLQNDGYELHSEKRTIISHSLPSPPNHKAGLETIRNQTDMTLPDINHTATSSIRSNEIA